MTAKVALITGTGQDGAYLAESLLARAVSRTSMSAPGWRPASRSFEYDATKPDAMLRKVMDVWRLQSLGWKARTPLDLGLQKAYDWYVKNAAIRQLQK